MENWSEERIGFLLGILGGLMFVLGAILAFVTGSIDLVTGRLVVGLSVGTESFLLAVLGVLSGLFAYLGYRAWRARPFSAALMLLIVAVIGAMSSGPGAAGLPLVGAVLVGLAGILYLIEPMKRAAHYVATA
jgi:hypothetical protein